MRAFLPVFAVFFGLAFIVPEQQAQNRGDFFSLQRRVVELFEDNKDALVRVKAVYEGDEKDETPQMVVGSGFFISREGLILTNASIAYDPVRLWIEHRDIAYSADLIGADRATNLALLRVNTLPKSFRFLHLADSADIPQIGNFVIRISMPLEFSPTPEWGLISGHESRFGDRSFPTLYIRTSIPAGPGDGGSAYLDLNGRLVGIQVGSLPDIGSSYILPSRAALRIRDDLLFNQEVNYGWIGFEVREEISIAEGKRVVLTEVFEGSPAEQTGLLAGDVIKRIGDYSVTTLDELRNAMFYTRVGQYSEVYIERDGESMRFNIRVAQRPANEPLEVIESEREQPSFTDGPLRQTVPGQLPESGAEGTAED